MSSRFFCVPVLREPTSESASARRAWLTGVLLAVLVVATYGASLRGGFLWDDDSHVTANPVIVGPLGLREIWTTPAANYFPLVLTNFWLQHALWGLQPLGYHVVTLALHALAAVLLWRVLLALRVAGAWLGAALWALHPMQVESVAWISELKNTQSAVCFLLAALFFLRWLEGGPVSGGSSNHQTRSNDRSQTDPTASHRHYFLALLCALLAVLSKPSTVMLPVALALGVWWQRGQLSRPG